MAAQAVAQFIAPCGHPGIPVSSNYVTCPICDAMPDRNKLDPTRHIMCPSCKTLQVTTLPPRNNAPWCRCDLCKLEFEPTRGNQP